MKFHVKVRSKMFIEFLKQFFEAHQLCFINPFKLFEVLVCYLNICEMHWDSVSLYLIITVIYINNTIT